MLTEERFTEILRMVKERGSVTVQELTQILNTSESTIRRDLIKLDKMDKLIKVHGGATANTMNYTAHDETVALRKSLHMEEKQQIGNYAASLIVPDDFVYLDAGTSTDCMIDGLESMSVVFVTNGIEHAAKLSRKGFTVFLTGGQLKLSTEAIVGGEAVQGLQKYNFTKGFFGSNGVDKERGFTTPDMEEARVKEEAMKRCKRAYVLADSSKIGQISPVKFAEFDQAVVLTTGLKQGSYRACKNIKEVDKL